MKYILLVLIFFASVSIYAQSGTKNLIEDTDIVNALLGRKHFEIQKQLDSLDVWYYMHLPEQNICYSIADGDGTVKLFTFYVTGGSVIRKIVINYRHDSKEQLEDAAKISDNSDLHVGRYSTDLIFKLE